MTQPNFKPYKGVHFVEWNGAYPNNIPLKSLHIDTSLVGHVFHWEYKKLNLNYVAEIIDVGAMSLFINEEYYEEFNGFVSGRNKLLMIEKTKPMPLNYVLANNSDYVSVPHIEVAVNLKKVVMHNGNFHYILD